MIGPDVFLGEAENLRGGLNQRALALRVDMSLITNEAHSFARHHHSWLGFSSARSACMLSLNHNLLRGSHCSPPVVSLFPLSTVYFLGLLPTLW